MTKRSLLALLLLVAVVAVGHAGQGSQPRRQQVYLFGFAASFADSTAYLTELQPVEAYVMPNGFLANRSLYSLQLENYMIGTLHREHMTCAVFFSKSRTKLERKYQKVSKRNRSNGLLVLQTLRTDEFHFDTEEWVEDATIIGDPNASAPEKKKSKKSKKK